MDTRLLIATTAIRMTPVKNGARNGETKETVMMKPTAA